MGATSAQASLRLAAAGIGAVRLGIPVDSVVQAIPVPAAPAMLPRRRGALTGVAMHEGTLVPVLDLGRWVDLGSAPAVGHPGHSGQAGRRILVLRAGARTIGLEVDSVDGLVELPAGAVRRLHHDDDPEEVFHSAAHVPGSGQILSLLDVGRLADLAAAWHEADGALPDAPVADAAELPADLHQYALLRLGAVRLGVPASDLAEVVAMPRLERLGGAGDGAWCRWRGRHLAVLPQGTLTAAAHDAVSPLLAIVEHGGLALGLPVEAALGLEPCPAGRAEPGALTATVYDTGGGELRLLDTAALFARFPEALLSRPEARQAPVAAPGTGTPNEGDYIVFEAGGLRAVPVADVEQILPLRPDQPCGGTADATMAWGGAAIPLVDLRPAHGHTACGHVLVVAGASGPAAYVVTRVELLVPAGSGRMYRMGAQAGKGLAFITVDAGGAQASYRIVDLTTRPPTRAA